jgi:hypothetical protein
MHRLYFYLAAFLALATVPVAAFAEMAAEPITTDTPHVLQLHTVNAAGFYVDLPALNHNQLLGLIRTYQDSLVQREEALTKFLDEHQLDVKDALITVIMPGGLLYAAVKKGNLEQAQAELAEINDDMDELARDLLAMQIDMRRLTVAQLQR